MASILPSSAFIMFVSFVELDLTFGTNYYCNLHATYLTHKRPQANISRFQASYFTGAAFKPQDRDQHSYTQTFVEPGLLGLG